MAGDRRTFLKFATAAAVSGAGSRILGANDRINIAVIGLGGRGRAHMNEWMKIPDARVAAVCDVNQEARERATALVKKTSNETPKEYIEMREAFEDKNIDAVSMPLPNHWHALATIWACQAGKDVYIEKPASHNIWEGRKMIEAARKYKRMVQIGSQSRSTPHKMEAMELVRNGEVGKIFQSRGICFKRRVSIGIKPDGPAPAGVDWDRFLGPAPMRPFNPNRFTYNWHWFWDTGNGDIGNQGVHQMDIAVWGPDWQMPNSASSTGGKFAYVDQQETPNTQLASMGYGDAELVFEVRGLLTDGDGALEKDRKNCIGNVFYGTEGYLAVDDDGYQVYKGEETEKVKDVPSTRGTSETQLHMENFAKAVRSRNHRDLNADVAIGVLAADLCHLANISYRVGQRLDWDPVKGEFRNSPEANKLVSREYRYPYVVPDKV